MTVGELIELLKCVPESSEMDIYDLRNYTHPMFKVDIEKYFNYDTGMPIVTIELDE